MRSIVLALILLLAVFTILRAYAEEPPRETRVAIYPGVVELQSGQESAHIAFGMLDASGKDTRVWNVLPLRIALQSGKNRLQLGLNGLSFLTRSGVHIGRPLRIRGVQRGNIVSIGGPVEVEGTVEGSVWTFGSDIRLLAGSTISGDAVALGGTIEADRRALIKGNKEALPEFRIPLLGLLTTRHSAPTLLLLMEGFGIVLFLLLLFLLVQYGGPVLGGLASTLAFRWKESVLVLALSALVVPVLVLLLVLSILGILMVPVLAMALITLAYLGYLGAATRLGLWVRGLAGETPLRLYTSGLLGLLILKGPVLIGIPLSMADATGLSSVGRLLTSLGTAAVALAGLYGFGGSLTWLRHRALA